MIRLCLLFISAGIAMTADNIAPLPPCLASPNCVSSLAMDADHRVEPILLRGSGKDALERLANIITGMHRSRIIEQRELFLHATFTSLVFRFVDDVHVRVDEDNQRIDLRSASRVGYWDLGVNRRRVEEIRKRFEGER
ncbi:MAG: DUF1499 domain-containing protein [Pseudomonadota bacterium]